MRSFLLTFAFAAAGMAATSTSYTPAPNIERLYRLKCSPCHGPDGGGGTGVSFKRKLAHPTTPAIEGVIKEGIPGTAMPGNPSMPDPTVHELALYIQYLNKKK